MKEKLLSLAFLAILLLRTTGITAVFAAQEDTNDEEIFLDDQTDLYFEESASFIPEAGFSSAKDLLAAPIAFSPREETEAEDSADLEFLESSEEEPGGADDAALSEYIVKPGDTVDHIADAFKVDPSDLYEWNDELTSESTLTIGQSMMIHTDLDIDATETKKLTGSESAASNATSETTEWSDNQQKSSESEASAQQNMRTMTVVASAYSRTQEDLTNFTAMGIDLRENPRVIAVDPTVIPLGTAVYIEGYGEAIAGDTGGAIVGNRIDLHMEDISEAFAWGMQTVQLTLLD